jgi:hypothetical protein
MGRRTVADPLVQEVIQSLVNLFLRVGSVNAMADVLSASLPLGASERQILPNRLHTVLSGDPNRSINDATLAAIRSALATLGPDFGGLQRTDATYGSSLTAAIRQRVQSGRAYESIAKDLAVPSAVVRILEGAPATYAGGAITMPRAQADWTFQDIAYARCREALRRGPARRVGLVIPTGGGKTRLALRIVLGELSDAPADAVVLWVTHRRRLRLQARRELQEMITEGTEELPENAVALLARRVVSGRRSTPRSGTLL